MRPLNVSSLKVESRNPIRWEPAHHEPVRAGSRRLMLLLLLLFHS
jgi:hypothetical protein